MKREEYKGYITRFNVLGFQVLEATSQVLRSKKQFEVVSEIQRILQQNKIEKPERHTDREGLSTNYYRVDLHQEDIEKIIDMFADLEVSSIGQNGETTQLTSYYSSLCNLWMNLVQKDSN